LEEVKDAASRLAFDIQKILKEKEKEQAIEIESDRAGLIRMGLRTPANAMGACVLGLSLLLFAMAHDMDANDITKEQANTIYQASVP